MWQQDLLNVSVLLKCILNELSQQCSAKNKNVLKKVAAIFMSHKCNLTRLFVSS